jgi:hypothetical protein
MMLQRAMPLIIIGIIVLILLAVAIWWNHVHKQSRIEEEVRAFAESDSACHDQDPKTGHICERWDHHPGNHRQVIDGEEFEWENDAATR